MQTATRHAPHDRDATLQAEALAELHRFGPSLRNGLFNHAPMVVDALVALGAAEAAPPWVASQRASFDARPPATTPIDPADPDAAIGARERFADWAAFFQAEIEARGWEPVLDGWCLRLAPGLTTAACHGWLRTAHAARALAREDGPAPRQELAEGLASWASMYAELPVSRSESPDTRPPAEALRTLVPVPEADRIDAPLIVAAYAALRHAPSFAGDVAGASLDGDPADRIDELVVVFADLFERRARSVFTAIAFAHAVTAAAALRFVAPQVSERTRTELVFRAWEAGCALEAALGVPDDGDEAPEPPALEAIIDAAVAHGDDHAIKLTEACVSTWRRRPEPVLLRAAQRAIALLPPLSPAE